MTYNKDSSITKRPDKRHAQLLKAACAGAKPTHAPGNGSVYRARRCSQAGPAGAAGRGPSGRGGGGAPPALRASARSLRSSATEPMPCTADSLQGWVGGWVGGVQGDAKGGATGKALQCLWGVHCSSERGWVQLPSPLIQQVLHCQTI